MTATQKDTLRTWANALGPHGLTLTILLILWKLIVYPEVEQNRAERHKLFELADRTAEVAISVRESANAARDAARSSETAARINEAVTQNLREIASDLRKQ